MERSHSCISFKAKSTNQTSATFARSSDNLMYNFPPNKPLRRRKKLQRQQSSIDLGMDYSPDMEEEDVEGQTEEEVIKRRAEEDEEVEVEAEEAEDDISLPMMTTTPFQCQQHCFPHPNAAALALQRHISCSSTSSSTTTSSAYSHYHHHHQQQSLSPRRCLRHEESFDSCSSTAAELSPIAQRQQHMLLRDSSVQSDSSRYSSVDSLLDSRKPDPEAILINLGFGPSSEDILSRIPKRFLKPSQVNGIDTEAFVKRLQLASSLADSRVLGYRGLTGNPDVPPSSIVAKIMERFEFNQRKKSMGSIEHTIQ